MKGKWKILLAVLLALGILGAFALASAEGTDGLRQDGDGVWRLYVNGEHAAWYNGLYCDANLGWWLVEGGTINFGYTGLYCDANVGWWLVNGGTINFDYTGLYCDANLGWWLVGGGAIAFDYTGLWYDANLGWWLVGGGTIAFDYNGLWYDEGLGWWLVQGGAINFGYTGLWNDPNVGWWLIGGGSIAWDYTGNWNDPVYGAWYISGGHLEGQAQQTVSTGIAYSAEFDKWVLMRDGQIDWNFSGLYEDADLGWWLIGGGEVAFWHTGLWMEGNDIWLVREGKLDFSYTGIWRDEKGIWYVKNGKWIDSYTGTAMDRDNGKWVYMFNGAIDDEFTGFAETDDGTAYYRNGTPALSFTGIARNSEGAWYIHNGYVDVSVTNYAFTDPESGIVYSVTDGKATAVSADNPMLAVFFSSREDTSDMLYVTFDGYNFYYIGNAFTDAYPNEEYNDVATIDNHDDTSVPEYYRFNVSTLRDPGLFYKDGAFWLLGDTVAQVDGSYRFFPLLSYSTDLVNWSFPGSGKDYYDTGVKPETQPLDANGNRIDGSFYHSAGTDAFVDDDGTVWLIVTMGYYADSSYANQLSHYLLKITDLTAPADSSGLITLEDKAVNSFFGCDYGKLIQINLPYTEDYVDFSQFKDPDGSPYSGKTFDYDGMLFKDGGKYYMPVQHDGLKLTLWCIDDLNKAGDPNAWTMVTEELAEGTEGPSMVKNYGKYFLYTDRLDGWQHNDEWGDYHGIFAYTSDTLTTTFQDHSRINAVDNQGNKLSTRHGTVITLPDDTAKKAVMNRYNEVYNAVK